jgi:hypothetical protein
MQATRAKQLLKNGIYRAIGETVAGTGALDGEGGRTLRALMYHKVNDIPGNPVTVPTSLFDEQMAQLRELGYQPVGLEEVIAHYVEAKPLPPGATLITFDDGYRDNLENALPVLKKHGYPAVLFVPIGYLGESRPLPHEERLAAAGVAGASFVSSRPRASASSATGSATGLSPTSRSTRRRARSSSPSSVWRRRSVDRCRPSPS